jgi:hypothetical protein
MPFQIPHAIAACAERCRGRSPRPFGGVRVPGLCRGGMRNQFHYFPESACVVSGRPDLCMNPTKRLLSGSPRVMGAARSGEDSLALFDEMISDLIVTGDSSPGISGFSSPVSIPFDSGLVSSCGSSQTADNHCFAN